MSTMSHCPADPAISSRKSLATKSIAATFGQDFWWRTRNRNFYKKWKRRRKKETAARHIETVILAKKDVWKENRVRRHFYVHLRRLLICNHSTHFTQGVLSLSLSLSLSFSLISRRHEEVRWELDYTRWLLMSGWLLDSRALMWRHKEHFWRLLTHFLRTGNFRCLLGCLCRIQRLRWSCTVE